MAGRGNGRDGFRPAQSASGRITRAWGVNDHCGETLILDVLVDNIDPKG